MRASLACRSGAATAADRRRARSERALTALLLLWFTGQVVVGAHRLVRREHAPPRPVTVDVVRDPAWRLTLLPGIGRARAWDIVRDRQRAPPYERLADLLRVPGIGPHTLRRLDTTRAVRVLLDGRPGGYVHERAPGDDGAP